MVIDNIYTNVGGNDYLDNIGDNILIIHFDGGLRKQMIAIVNADTNEIIIEKRLYDNEFYEWDALEMALDYVKNSPWDQMIQLIGDSNEVIRWLGEKEPETNGSIIKQKCLEKITELRKNRFMYSHWVKRNENLAGRALEYHTRRSSQPTRFIGAWHACTRCVFRSLSEKELSEHFYNEHVTNG